jgi:predicted AlkP superfamily phosphohydrolase/phosphomutase
MAGTTLYTTRTRGLVTEAVAILSRYSILETSACTYAATIEPGLTKLRTYTKMIFAPFAQRNSMAMRRRGAKTRGAGGASPRPSLPHFVGACSQSLREPHAGDQEMMEISKVLVIGLDGVTFDLLSPLFARGLLPFLQSIVDRGYSGGLLSTVPPISATAWTTFMTGVNPGKHGILQFVDLRPIEADSSIGVAQEVFPGGVSFLNADSIRSARLWDILNAARKRQIIINLPLTYPPCPVNGLMVTGMMTPPSASVFTYPPNLSGKLLDAGYEIDLAVSEKEFDFDPGRLIQRLHEVLVKRQNVALQLLESEAWDLSMVVFTGTDRLQHRFWKYLAPGFPEYDSVEAVQLRPRLEQYFEDLDQALARLVNCAGPNALTIVLSDHGFGPVSQRTIHRLSLMQALGLAEEGTKSGIGRLRTVIEGYLGLTPDQIRKAARLVLPRRWISRLETRARHALLAASAKDPAYSVTLHEYVGGIYINREQFVDDTSLGAFRQQIISDLERVVDPETSTSLIAKVYTREELYSGPALEECPDIVFYVTPGYGLSGSPGPGGEIVSPRRSDPNKQGTHRDEGILLIHGPNVNMKQGVQERLMDVTSTILYSLDVPIPITMDSRPILGAFDEQFVAKHPPRYVDAALESRIPDMPELESRISEEDAEQLLARLRGLGYIE